MTNQSASYVDIHSPTAAGKIEEIGFSKEEFQKGIFQGWNMISFETYNHLGKLDPTLKPWRKRLNAFLGKCFHGAGALFSVILQKPKA